MSLSACAASSVMAAPATDTVTLQDSVPFPLEELYVPIFTIAGFFICMMLCGCVYSLTLGREPSEKKNE